MMAANYFLKHITKLHPGWVGGWVEGRTKMLHLKNLILTLFGLIFRRIYIQCIYTPYAGAAGMLLRINGKFTMEKLKSSLLS